MELNGAPVQVEDFHALWAARNYGHFTVIPVQDKKALGLSRHLDRLQQNSQILYGCRIDPLRVLAYVRHALAATTASSLAVRVDVLSLKSRADPSRKMGDLDVLVTVRAMPGKSHAPLRVQTIQYERDLPQVKHVGTFGLVYYRHLAQVHGFDDALFIDASGRIAEGSGWNVGFFDGQRIIWPHAPSLPGIGMQLIQAGLKKHHIPFEVREVRCRDLSAFNSAFLTDCLVGAQAIASIDDVTFEIDTHLNALLKECYEANPLEKI